MKEKVFGIGFSKTGTTTLEEALKVLGYRMYWGHFKHNTPHYLHALYVNGDYDEILKVSQYFDAFADAPWGGSQLYKELATTYPNAYYVLTYRDPETWYDSFERMITKFDKNLETAMETFHQKGRYGAVYFFKHVFNIDQLAGNRQKIIDHYKRHNEEVACFFENSNYKFKQINFTEGEEWQSLCDFLGEEIPDQPFPHKNKGKSADSGGAKNEVLLKEKIKYKLIQGIQKL